MEDPQLGMNHARLVKLVIVGPAGVGKTSLRHQYISGRFAVGYRATIGTDFITKTLPHYSQIKTSKPGTSLGQPPTPHAATSASASTSSQAEAQTAPTTTPLTSQEPTTLQIWDTAGQERFSSLSAAFFRGADAVILVFDVNKPNTLNELQRWWDEFRTKVPIQEGEESNFCVVVVGNKADQIGSRKGGDKGKEAFVTNNSAQEFLQRLIPVPKHDDEEGSIPATNQEPPLPSPMSNDTLQSSSSLGTQPSNLASIPAIGGLEDATPRPDLALRSPASRFGTMASTRTGFSIYHTPSSSLFTTIASPSASDRQVNQLTTPYPFTSEPSEMLPLGPRLSSSRVHYAPPNRSKEDDLEMSMDLEYDYNYDLHHGSSQSANASESGYATAKSTPSVSPTSPSHDEDSRRRPRIGSMASDTSFTTIRPSGPTPAIAFRNRVLERQASGKSALVSPSPSRSRRSSTSSATTPSTTQHNIRSDELPTPSASPPSPPVLTASLMATLHQQRQEEEEAEQGQLKLDVGPKLFFTSAKTGGARGTLHPSVDVDFETTPVSEIFAYVAKRVVQRWEWEESQEALDLVGGTDALTVTGKSKSLVVRLGEGWSRMTSGLQGSCCST